MPFNEKAFMKEKFLPREAGIEVPDLSAFFAKDEKPVWVVRGLTASEIARCNERQAGSNNLSAVLEALSTGTNKEKIDAIRSELGINDDVPGDIAKRIAHLAAASINPAISHEASVKLAEVHPIYFYQLTNKIMELTGLGQELKKKSNSSTEETTLEPASASLT